MAPPRTSAGYALVAALLRSRTMPHYRTRPMLVARGRQPIGVDRRLPCSPVVPVIVAEPVVEATVNEVVDPDVDDGENARTGPPRGGGPAGLNRAS